MSASLTVYEKEHAASEKYNYFLCTVAGALFAYIAKDYTPHRLDSWYDWIMPSALASLTMCFGCGLASIQLLITVTKINKHILAGEEQSVQMNVALAEHRKSATPIAIVDYHSGKAFTAVELEEQIKRTQSTVAVDKRIMHNKNSRGEFAKNLCRVFLIIGFLLILASKVAQPYLAK